MMNTANFVMHRMIFYGLLPNFDRPPYDASVYSVDPDVDMVMNDDELCKNLAIYLGNNADFYQVFLTKKDNIEYCKMLFTRFGPVMSQNTLDLFAANCASIVPLNRYNDEYFAMLSRNLKTFRPCYDMLASISMSESIENVRIFAKYCKLCAEDIAIIVGARNKKFASEILSQIDEMGILDGPPEKIHNELSPYLVCEAFFRTKSIMSAPAILMDPVVDYINKFDFKILSTPYLAEVLRCLVQNGVTSKIEKASYCYPSTVIHAINRYSHECSSIVASDSIMAKYGNSLDPNTCLAYIAPEKEEHERIALAIAANMKKYFSADQMSNFTRVNPHRDYWLKMIDRVKK